MLFELQDSIVIYSLLFIQFELSFILFNFKLKQYYNSQLSYSIFWQVNKKHIKGTSSCFYLA